eukprot:364023-Chlamydomonas_euryale.AAC.1
MVLLRHGARAGQPSHSSGAADTRPAAAPAAAELERAQADVPQGLLAPAPELRAREGEAAERDGAQYVRARALGYSVVWVASDAVHRDRGGLRESCVEDTVAVSCHGQDRGCRRGRSVGVAMSASASVLQAWAAMGAEAPRLRLATHGTHSHAVRAPSNALSSAAGAGAWAAARCWAQESSSGAAAADAWDGDAWCSGEGVSRGALSWRAQRGNSQQLHGAEPEADGRQLYGSCTAGGVAFHATLLPLPAGALTSAPATAPGGPPRRDSCPGRAAGLDNRRGGAYVVTGGSGSVAAHVALWLVLERGATHVRLVSRSGLLPPALLRELSCVAAAAAAADAAGGEAPAAESGAAGVGLGSSGEYVVVDPEECAVAGGRPLAGKPAAPPKSHSINSSSGGRCSSSSRSSRSNSSNSSSSSSPDGRSRALLSAVFVGCKLDVSCQEDAAAAAGSCWSGQSSHDGDRRSVPRGTLGARPPLLGLFHASGALSDATVMRLRLAALRKAAAPKSEALARLADSPLLNGLNPCGEHVLFSSVASLL